MDLAFVFPKEKLRPWLRRFWQRQQLFVFIGVVLYSFFAALRLGLPFVVIMVLVLTLGNLTFPLMEACTPLYNRRAFPWNWVIFLPITAAVGVLSAFGAVILVKWMVPVNMGFWVFFRNSVPVALVICIAISSVGYLVRQIKERLEAKNIQLEQAVAKGSLALQQQEQELQRAREIQQDLLPKTLPQLPGLELAGAWQPARTVGGDYFDVIQLDSNHLGLCIGDVAGKGITAALLMANLQASFRALATPEESPAAVCSKLNAFLCGNVAPGKFITFFYAILNVAERTLHYENAGHCPAVLVKATGGAELLPGGGAVLGVMPDWQYKDFSVPLHAGDRLLLYTDGLTEAANAQNEEFGIERIIQSAQKDGLTPLRQANPARTYGSCLRFLFRKFPGRRHSACRRHPLAPSHERVGGGARLSIVYLHKSIFYMLL